MIAESSYRGGAPCPACRSTKTTSRGECMACGHVFGESFRCPFCERTNRPAPHALLVAACPACSEPRIDPKLPTEAYGPLREMRRSYGRLHARALVYVPLFAALLAVVVTIGLTLLAARSEARGLLEQPHYEGAYYVVPRHERNPRPTALVFVGSLAMFGALGVGVYAAAASVLGRRVRDEATRLATVVRRDHDRETAPGPDAPT